MLAEQIRDKGVPTLWTPDEAENVIKVDNQQRVDAAAADGIKDLHALLRRSASGVPFLRYERQASYAHNHAYNLWVAKC